MTIGTMHGVAGVQTNTITIINARENSETIMVAVLET